jgi:uncharacterized membrane protein YbhN (UPF0104 family)
MKQNKKKEFSKRLCKFSLAIFTIVMVLGILLCFSERTTDFFAYAIPSTGALAAASIAFYFNKAKAENLSKQKLRNVVLKLYLEDRLDSGDAEEILTEIEFIDETLQNKLNSDYEDAINEDTEIEL